MTGPRRIQRRRTKGWRKPDGAVCVDRSSRWGNPYAIGQPIPLSAGVTPLASREPVTVDDLQHQRPDLIVTDADHAITLYRAHLDANPVLVRRALIELRGRDLACYCDPDLPCHADVLLEYANQSHCHEGGCCTACYDGTPTHPGAWAAGTCLKRPYTCPGGNS